MNIERQNIHFEQNCPSDARDLILKLLIIDPAKRYTLKEALNHPFMKNWVDVHGPKGQYISKPPKMGRGEITESTAEIIDDFVENNKDMQLGHVDDKGNYIAGKANGKYKAPPMPSSFEN